MIHHTRAQTRKHELDDSGGQTREQAAGIAGGFPQEGAGSEWCTRGHLPLGWDLCSLGCHRATIPRLLPVGAATGDFTVLVHLEPGGVATVAPRLMASVPGMELFEHEEVVTLRREEAAARLRELADQLERHNQVSVKVNGLPVTVKVPDQVTFELEVELEGEESEIEVTISW